MKQKKKWKGNEKRSVEVWFFLPKILLTFGTHSQAARLGDKQASKNSKQNQVRQDYGSCHFPYIAAEYSHQSILTVSVLVNSWLSKKCPMFGVEEFINLMSLTYKFWVIISIIISVLYTKSYKTNHLQKACNCVETHLKADKLSVLRGHGNFLS